VASEQLADQRVARIVHLEARFRRAVQDIATLSGGLLASGDATIMAVAAPSDGWSLDLPLLMWDDHFAPRPDTSTALCAATLVSPALDALCLAADDLFATLREARICPPGTVAVSVVTDGTGVALTAEMPGSDTADAAWLLTLARCDGRATAVLPFARDGAWALLAATADGAMVH
jgi:hypothetical protein